MTGRRLELADIADQRAYERERPAFLDHVIALKRRRRVRVGELVAVVFENRETVRFQVQEMARAERLISDEQIQTELDVYNPLVPSPGELSATLFLELTTEDELRTWLPALVGIERSIVLRVGDDQVRSTPEAQHEAQLTRDDVTASVHYVRFALTPEQVDRFATAPVRLAVDHPSYQAETLLGDETRRELLADLLPDQAV